MSDLSLNINLKAVDNASSALSSLANGISKNFGNAFGNLKFAMQNIRTEGTLSKDAFKAASGDMSQALAGVGVAVAAVGVAAAVAIGTKAVDAAKDFQQSLLKIQAYAGLTKKETDSMSQSLLDMAGAVGVGPKELADALYPLISSGYSASDALNMLKLSAETAAASGAKTSVVADGLSTVLKTFDIDASSSSYVMDVLNKTVAQGKMEFPGLASVIGKLSLSASGAKVPFADMNAALATLTTHGFPSVNQAATALGNMFTQIGVKTDALAKHAKAAGVSFDAHAFSTMNLSEKMAYLSKITDGNQGKLLALLGGNNLALKSFNALSGGAEDYSATLQKLQNAHGTTAQVFATAQQGFNQQMNQAKANIDALMIRIGTALLPVLGQLMAQVGPLITQFTAWDAKHHFIENAAKALGAALSSVISIISGLIQVISTVVHFFQQNEIALYMLYGVLGLVGAIILAIVIPAIITMIGSLLGLIGTVLLVAAPFIIIGALIGLIIFGIVKAIQNWGAIVHWLQGVWGAVSSWFMSMLHALGAFFVGVWNHIVDGLKAAWNFIVQVVRIGVMVMLAIIFAPIVLVAALFIWLYQHNTYFKKLVDAIVGFVQFGISWLRQAWQDVVNWLAALWQSIVGIATNVWNTVTSAIKTTFNNVIAGIIIVWQMISGVFSSAYNTYIAGPLKAAWNFVSGVFTSAWNTYIAKPLSDLWNSVSKWFTDLGASALNSGKNFITMLVSGITSGAGKIWDAVTGIAKNIWKALGFHSPAEEGPGADADKWMPNLVSMLSTGLVAGVPKIQAAVNLVAKPLSVIGHPGNASGVSGPVAAPAASGGGGTVNNFNISIANPLRNRKDIQDLVKQIEDEMSRNTRRSGNFVTQTSGGAQ
ncbi:MAG TPA: phage tail tape measure protein [Ktedonobacteraceae bacterium]|nr:phage tail tape measure protein [Ktedonobacteraceae bacterium]